jgi:glucose/arabinose dehydrogenase
MIGMRWAASLVGVAALTASAAAQGNNGSIPPSSARMVSALDGKLRVPDGFKVQVFADTVAGARFMALGPDGAVYVSLPRGGASGGRGRGAGAGGGNMDAPRSAGGQVLRLIDRNNDGVAEAREIVVNGVEGAHGLAFHNGYLYIAGLRGVYRVKLDASGTPRGEPERLNEYPYERGHSTRTIVFGRDGAMYVSIGSSCNICIETHPEFAAVMRYDADGKNGRLYSSGLRNAVGMAVHPTTGEIWVSQHERDNLAPDFQDLPHEEVNILGDGAHFGWPFCHGNRIANPDTAVANHMESGFCARTVPPALELQAHSAPLGLTFLDRATMFPAEYRGDAVLALHGSWNRNVPVGAVVVRIRTRDGKPVGYEEFVSGFQGESTPGQMPNRWGRPVDVLVYKDGSLLISDDGGQPRTRNPGAIYRVYR